MISYSKRIIAAVLTVIVAFTLCACSSAPRNSGDSTPTPRPLPENTMRIYLTVDATGAAGSDRLGEEVRAGLGSGLLMNGASVTLPMGSVFSDLFRLLELAGIPVTTAQQDGVNRIASVKSVQNGDLGADSGWMILINGDPTTEDVDAIKLTDGDAVRLFFTLNGGADAGK